MERRPVAEILLTAAVMAVWAWISLSPDDRRTIRLGVLSAARKVSGFLARAAGRSGMRQELAGDVPHSYSVAEFLSRIRDKFSAWYERGRI